MPSKLEIITKDLDHNGKYETYLEYRVGTDRTDSYLILEEGEGDRIVIKKYEVKPAKIIPE